MKFLFTHFKLEKKIKMSVRIKYWQVQGTMRTYHMLLVVGVQIGTIFGEHLKWINYICQHLKQFQKYNSERN